MAKALPRKGVVLPPHGAKGQIVDAMAEKRTRELVVVHGRRDLLHQAEVGAHRTLKDVAPPLVCCPVLGVARWERLARRGGLGEQASFDGLYGILEAALGTDRLRG